MSTTPSASATEPGKVTAGAAYLAAALRTIAPAVPDRPGAPAHGVIRLAHDGANTLSVTAFDHPTMISVRMPATSPFPWEALLSHEDLSGTLTGLGITGAKKHTDTVLSLSTVDGAAHLAVDGYRLPVQAHPGDAVDAPPAVPPALAEVDTAALAAELARVAPAAAGPSNPHEVLHHLHLAVHADRLELTATDQYRSAWSTLPLSRPAVGDGGPVYVTAHADLVRRTGAHLGADTTALVWSTDLFGLVSGPVTVLTRPFTQTGKPDIAKHFKGEYPVAATADRAQLLQATARARKVLTSRKEKGVPVRLALTPGGAAVVPHLPGAQAPAVPADVTGTPGLDLHFPPARLAAALEAITSPAVTVHAAARSKPVVLTGGGQDPDTAPHRQLIMPVRIR